MLLLPRLRLGSALFSVYCSMLFVAFYGVILFQLMVPTAYVLMVGGLVAFVLGIAGVCANWRSLRTRILSPGALVYLVGSCACVLLTLALVIRDHDALSYWARAAKELFTYDRFYIHMDTTMFHTDYIPVLAALQYCVTRVFGWQDAYLVYVTFAGIIVSICAAADLLNSKGWGLAVAILLAYAYGVFGFSYLQIRADGPMCIIFAAALLCLYARSENSPSALLPTLCATAILPGMKIYSGLMFAAVLLICLLCQARKETRSNSSISIGGSRVVHLYGFVALILVILMQLSWSGLYNYSSAVASYENAAATAAFTDKTFTESSPVFSFASLFSGNPRNAALIDAFTPQTLRSVAGLCTATLSTYLHSTLPYALLFLFSLLLLGDKAERPRIMGTLKALLGAAIIYVLGLFGSYFVQAETSGAAMVYLCTVSTPMVIVSLFFAVRAASQGQFKIRGRWLTALMTVCLLVLLPPARWAEGFAPQTTYDSYSALAHNFFESEIAGQVLPEDAGKHALLIDCTYESSEIKSESGKTHAYHYFGMPLRLHVRQYPYGSYDALDSISSESLIQMLNENRCELLILRIEDELYWDAFKDALDLDDSALSIAVYDIVRENGATTFVCRAENDY